MNQHCIPSLPSKQTGAVLVVSLLMLVIMTLIGVTSMRTTILQEKMSGNTRDTMLAFQAAETVLLDGESFVENDLNALAVAFDGTRAGLYPADTNPNPFLAATWADDASRIYSGLYAGVTTQPRYIVEILKALDNPANDLNAGDSYDEIASLGTRYAFRVTARGTGGTDNAQSIIQSNYIRAF